MTDINTEGTVEQATQKRTLQKATFGAGCFWGVEVTFRNTPGVVDAIVGYEGGRLENPTYHDVCSHTTGHAEVVEVTYDPAEVSYEKLLEVFWDEHDPTQLNRQGPDVGDQYRSVIFFHTPEQEAEARASKERLQASGKYRRPIVTLIEPAQTFYKAEEYHQRYLQKHGLATCRI
jgi:peptide-methionine (S)-S-oxide reductase